MSEAEVHARRSWVTAVLYLRLCVAEEKGKSWRGLGLAFQDSRWLRDLIWTCCIWAPRGMAYCNKGPANEAPGQTGPLCAHKGLLHPGGGVARAQSWQILKQRSLKSVTTRYIRLQLCFGRKESGRSSPHPEG